MDPGIRRIDEGDLEPALLAGLLLSAGGSGRRALHRHRAFGVEALRLGDVELVPASSLADTDDVIVATGVGAPGFANAVTSPEDSLQAARALIAASGASPKAVIPGHVPGTYAWVLAAGLGLKLLDAAANGRGHPTVTLGGMGMASRNDVSIHQVCVNRHHGLEVVARGNLVATSNIMRSAAVQCGGLVMAVRGPLSSGFVASHGATRAIGFQLELGHAMAGAGSSGARRIEAALACLNGEVLMEGEIASNDVAYHNGFDVGRVVVRQARQRDIGGGDAGREVSLGVYNEFMTVDEVFVDEAASVQAAAAPDVAVERLATFPDLIACMDPETGDPLAISELAPGTRVMLIMASQRHLPLGAGVFDTAAYPEIEQAMGAELVRYLPAREGPAE
jgi:DUF917 family protein